MNNTTNNTSQENKETQSQPGSEETSNTEEQGKVRSMNTPLEGNNDKQGIEDASQKTTEQNTPAQKESQEPQLGGNSKNSKDN